MSIEYIDRTMFHIALAHHLRYTVKPEVLLVPTPDSFKAIYKDFSGIYHELCKVDLAVSWYFGICLLYHDVGVPSSLWTENSRDYQTLFEMLLTISDTDKKSASLSKPFSEAFGSHLHLMSILQEKDE